MPLTGELARIDDELGKVLFLRETEPHEPSARMNRGPLPESRFSRLTGFHLKHPAERRRRPVDVVPGPKVQKEIGCAGLHVLDWAGPVWLQLVLFSSISIFSLLLFRGPLMKWMQIVSLPRGPVLPCCISST